MRIGVDVDGVLADFNTGFIDIVKRVTGRDLFGDDYVPTTWNYPEKAGYTDKEVLKVWDTIRTNPSTFWLSLRPYWDAMTALERLRILSTAHDVYFITARPGMRAKHQTEVWLATHSGDFMWNPTVLISSEKGCSVAALELDMYVDDRFDNVCDAIDWLPSCETYLLRRPWNEKLHDHEYKMHRIDAVSDMLDVIDEREQRAA